MRQRVALVLALAVLAALGVGYLARNDPEEGIAFFPKWVFRVTSREGRGRCPDGGQRASGFGMSRAIVSAARSTNSRTFGSMYSRSA